MADWQKGDLALCVKVGSWTYDGLGPKAGDVDTVKEVEVGPDGALYLGLTDYRGDAFWEERYLASRFRKITPDKADEFDREVIDLMAGKKVPA